MQFACYSQRAKWCGTTSVARIKRRNAILALRLAKRHGPVTVALKSIRLLLTGGKMMRSEDWYSPPPLLLLLYHRSILQFPLILHDLQVSFAYQTDAARHVGPLCFPIVHSLWLGPALMTYMWKKCDDIYVEDVWWICGRRVVPYMWKTCGAIYVEDVWWHICGRWICGRRVVTYMWKTCGGYVEDVWWHICGRRVKNHSSWFIAINWFGASGLGRAVCEW